MLLLSTCACVRVGGLASIASDNVVCHCHCLYVPSPSSPAPPPLPSSPSHRCLCVLTVMIIVASWHPVTSITPSSLYVIVPPSALLIHPHHHCCLHFHYFFVSSPVRPCARHHRGTQPRLSHRCIRCCLTPTSTRHQVAFVVHASARCGCGCGWTGVCHHRLQSVLPLIVITDARTSTTSLCCHPSCSYSVCAHYHCHLGTSIPYVLMCRLTISISRRHCCRHRPMPLEATTLGSR